MHPLLDDPNSTRSRPAAGAPTQGRAPMATTEQRSGFRLPWAAEARLDTAMAETTAEPSGDIPDASLDAPTPEASVTQDSGTATVESSSTAWPSNDETLHVEPEGVELPEAYVARSAT